jgi:hypothetical protein
MRLRFLSLLCLAFPAASAAQGVTGRPNPYLFVLDLAGTPLDEFPGAVKALNGTMTVVDKNGQRMLRASSSSEFLITLPQALPADFTVEVELIPKACCNPEDFMLEGTPSRNRGVASAELTWQPAHIMAVGGGGAMYQSDMPADLAASTPGNLTRLVWEFKGTTLKHYTNGRRLYTLDKQFVRGRVLRVFLGGQDERRNAVYLAGLRIGTGPAAPGVIAASGGQPSALSPQSNPRPTINPTQQQTVSSSQGLTGGPAPTFVANVSVTQGSTGPVVSWQGVAAPATYTVQRWKIDDRSCCNNASGNLTGPPWQDVQPPLAGTYVYQVTVSTSGGTATGQAQFINLQQGSRIASAALPPVSAPNTSSGGVAPGFTVTVTMGPQGPVVTWPLVPNATGYTVTRSKSDDANCCNTSSGRTWGATSPWQDGPLPMPGTYVYTVLANTAFGQLQAQTQYTLAAPITAVLASPTISATAAPMPAPISPSSTTGGTVLTPTQPGSTTSPMAPASVTPITNSVPPGDPTGFTGSSPSPATVQLSWQGVAGATGYLVSGPGIPQGTIVTGTGHSVPWVPAGLQTYQVASVTTGGVVTQASSWPSVVVRVMPRPGVMLFRPNGFGGLAEYNLHACNAGKWVASQLLFPNSWCFLDAYGKGDVNAFPLLALYGIQEFDDTWFPDPPRITPARDHTMYTTWPWARFDAKVPEAVFGDLADLYRGRRVGCVQRGTGAASSTFCWASTAPHDALAIFGGADPVSLDPVNDARVSFSAQTRYDNVSVIVQTPQETHFLVLGGRPCRFVGSGYDCTNGGLRGKPDIHLDSQGPRSVPHVCLACHGGRFDPATGRVTGATLLALDPSGFGFSDPISISSIPGSPRSRQEENIRLINLAVFTSPGVAPGVLQYITDLYGGRQAVPGTAADDNRVPSGWTTQPGLYQNVYRPYCATCHSALTGPLGFQSWGDLLREKARVKTAVCGGAMPHAEVPFLRFWTRGGNLLLPGALLTALGVSGCS